MYSFILCAAAALVISLVGYSLDGWGWGGGLFIALMVFVVSWILWTRRMGRQLQPKMEAVRKLAERGQIDAARRSLAEMLPMGRWVPLLTGQLHAQLGVLALHSGEENKAIEHLSQATRRSPEGQLMLAALHYRRKNPAEALKVMAAAAPFHQKDSLVQNVYAYLLQKEGRVDDAIAQLNLLVRKSPEDAIGKDNLRRLQNQQRMDLKVFGNEWFALGLERPPASMGELRTVRKGFRQQPKKRRPR